MKFETKLDATRHWVRGFNAMPLDFVIKGVTNDDNGLEYDFFEKVEVLATRRKDCSNCGAEMYADAETCEECGSDELLYTYDLPMWGTVWTFEEQLDEDWAYQNADVLAECGINVYSNDDIGVFIGIDGAGYDFYEAHWVPLYEARGLRWHKE